jgi:hypothetical protein
MNRGWLDIIQDIPSDLLIINFIYIDEGEIFANDQINLNGFK